VENYSVCFLCQRPIITSSFDPNLMSLFWRCLTPFIRCFHSGLKIIFASFQSLYRLVFNISIWCNMQMLSISLRYTWKWNVLLICSFNYLYHFVFYANYSCSYANDCCVLQVRENVVFHKCILSSNISRARVDLYSFCVFLSFHF